MSSSGDGRERGEGVRGMGFALKCDQLSVALHQEECVGDEDGSEEEEDGRGRYNL